MENIHPSNMQLIIWIIGGLGSIASLLLVALTTIAWFSFKNQRSSNTQNVKEHGLIFTQLTRGSGIFSQIQETVKTHTGKIDNLDDRVDKHDIELVKIDGKIKGIYTKVQ